MHTEQYLLTVTRNNANFNYIFFCLFKKNDCFYCVLNIYNYEYVRSIATAFYWQHSKQTTSRLFYKLWKNTTNVSRVVNSTDNNGWLAAYSLTTGQNHFHSAIYIFLFVFQRNFCAVQNEHFSLYNEFS